MPASPSTAIIAPRLRSPRGGLTVGDRYYRPGVFLPESARPALEALASKAAKAARVEPMTIGIGGHSCAVASAPCDPSIGSVGYLLTPAHKPLETYAVFHNTDGQTCCSCADWVFRKAALGQDCKHGARLAELGLIPSTRPRTLPPFTQRSPVALPAPWTDPTPTYRNRFEATTAEVAEAATLLAWR